MAITTKTNVKTNITDDIMIYKDIIFVKNEK